MDSTFALSYAISKQLAAATAINTSYGDIELDDEMRAALDAALRPILKRRLNRIIANGQPQGE
ncbi:MULTISPECIES: hypothetical protein [Achromobacter]|uniref:hypothetical protein n=1 Tax=Achromobacter TaxID=222 RepID=UPI0006C09DD1|nr:MULTISPECIES: hypothetical protein [Achromobacter]MDF3939612.1 hypothetical protein [Achromobacter denitrificans]QQE57439.1 hypothetical protein I6H41_31995 [Achromobacter xylosoxidans]QQV17078.1 hypothetical protein I6I48_14935 [Achromobacter xylosoxidans]CUI48538.1 Uncharacterised protein [Achromobacter xylosoxidans]